LYERSAGTGAGYVLRAGPRRTRRLPVPPPWATLRTGEAREGAGGDVIAPDARSELERAPLLTLPRSRNCSRGRNRTPPPENLPRSQNCRTANGGGTGLLMRTRADHTCLCRVAAC
jgi:hypothetical protein